MGGNSQHRNHESNRPESGGADHDESFAKSGLLEREKEEFAAREAEKNRSKPGKPDESADPGAESGPSSRESHKDDD